MKQYEPLKMECQHFLDCIRTGDKPESSGYDGLRVVQILEAASESLKQDGAKVEIQGFEKARKTDSKEATDSKLLQLYDL